MMRIPAFLFAAWAWVLPSHAGTGSPGSDSGKAAPDALSEFRGLAAALRQRGMGSDTGLVLEYQVNRRTNACTDHEPEIRLRLRGNGVLELLRTRSFAESGRHGPGDFQARAGKADWDSLFLSASGMKWEASGFGLPMPGMSESNQVILLHHGDRTAKFEFTGSVPPGQGRIEAGLGAVTGLLRVATADTLWSLELAAAKTKARGGKVDVRALWYLRGKQALRFRMPGPGRGDACGSLALLWLPEAGTGKTFPTLATSRNRAYPDPAPGEAGIWKELRPGDSLAMDARFPLPKTGRGPRKGGLMHLGLPAALPGSGDTLALTLFSGDFPF